MKDLLFKIIKSTVSICFKSGEKINNVVIEDIMGNAIIAKCDGKIKMIEIPHIAYVSIEADIREALETILKNGQCKQEENKSDNNDKQKDNKKDNEKCEKKDDGKDTDKDSDRDNRKNDKRDYEKDNSRDSQRDYKKDGKHSFGY